MSNFSKTPQYTTMTFNEVWNNVSDFKANLAASPFAGCIHYGESETKTVDGQQITITYPDNVNLLFYLLYARYGNNPIANGDVNQFKYKIFSIMFQYGPTWEKRLDVQKKLRDISDDDLRLGSKSIYNHAFNPSTAPSTGSLDELSYINDQNTSSYKKSKMDAYMQLWELLRTDVSEEFLRQFKKCFKVFVSPEMPLVYISDASEEDEEEEE